jgi:hypothetical protein
MATFAPSANMGILGNFAKNLIRCLAYYIYGHARRLFAFQRLTISGEFGPSFLRKSKSHWQERVYSSPAPSLPPLFANLATP